MLIAVVARHCEPHVLLVLDGLLAYRRRYRLNWDVRLCDQRAAKRLENSGWWLIQARSEWDLLPHDVDPSRVLTVTGSEHEKKVVVAMLLCVG